MICSSSSEKLILGIESKTFYIICAVCLLLLLIAIYFYLASVFVDKNQNKIIERLGKYSKTLRPGWHLILPLFDKVVGVVPIENVCVKNENPILFSNEFLSFELLYIARFKILEHDKYFYFRSEFNSLVEERICSLLTKEFIEEKFQKITDVYNFYFDSFLKNHSNDLTDLGVELRSLSFLSVKRDHYDE